MTETLANGYSSESTRRELSNEYQHDRVKMIFMIFCALDESKLSSIWVNPFFLWSPLIVRPEAEGNLC